MLGSEWWFLNLHGPLKKGEKIDNIKAFELEGVIFLKESTSVDELAALLVHEGTHALDSLDELLLDFDYLFKSTGEIIHQGEKMSEIINKLDLTYEQLIEFRARIFEREIQILLGQKLDFETIGELTDLIEKLY